MNLDFFDSALSPKIRCVSNQRAVSSGYKKGGEPGKIGAVSGFHETRPSAQIHQQSRFTPYLFEDVGQLIDHGTVTREAFFQGNFRTLNLAA